MKKLALLVLLFALLAGIAVADEITFSFIAEDNNFDVHASAAGFTAGPALNVLVSDSERKQRFPLLATFNASDGAATSFVITSSTVEAAYGPGAVNSVTIIQGSTPILTGNMQESRMDATFPGGTGSFHGIFDVTLVDPAVLALFGLGPKFDPRGAVSVTFGQNELVGSQLNGVIGGGTTTIVVSTVPEPNGLAFAGAGMLTLAFLSRKWRLSR